MLPAAVIDVLFYVVFAAVAAREVLAAKNRNLPIVALVLLFGVASALDHLAAAGVTEAGLGARAGIALVVLMITLIGGRIIPAFSRNWLTKHRKSYRLPPAPPFFYRLVICAPSPASLFLFLLPVPYSHI